jgi:hypothetical protein
MWSGRLSQVGQTDWFEFPVRENRLFTVVTEALDESGLPSDVKAMPGLGVWDAFKPTGSAPVGYEPGLNGYATGESWLQVASDGDDVVRLAIADMRGDGRPDYAYTGWLLYADTVAPERLPASGGPIVIHGVGFRVADTVLVGGRPAPVTSVSPNEITAIAPASGKSGSVDVEVEDEPQYSAAAVIPSGVSYDAGTGDALTLASAPANTVPMGVPMAFTVTALAANLTPAGGVTVTYSVVSGTAQLGCGNRSCSVTASGDGHATMAVTTVDTNACIVTAALTNGSSVQAHFNGGNPPALSALTPGLSLAAGASLTWTTEALVLTNGVPVSGQSVTWQTGAAIALPDSSTAISDANGIATKTLTVGPLSEGQQTVAAACLNGTAACVGFAVLGARAEYSYLTAVSGTSQSVALNETPGQITLRVLDVNGNSMAGGTVTLYQSVYAWSPPCGPHGRCAEAELLSTEISTATSALDGCVSFAPVSIPGVATNLVALAVTGNTSTLSIALERHP